MSKETMQIKSHANFKSRIWKAARAHEYSNGLSVLVHTASIEMVSGGLPLIWIRSGWHRAPQYPHRIGSPTPLNPIYSRFAPHSPSIRSIEKLCRYLPIDGFWYNKLESIGTIHVIAVWTIDYNKKNNTIPLIL